MLIQNWDIGINPTSECRLKLHHSWIDE